MNLGFDVWALGFLAVLAVACGGTDKRDAGGSGATGTGAVATGGASSGGGSSGGAATGGATTGGATTGGGATGGASTGGGATSGGAGAGGSTGCAPTDGVFTCGGPSACGQFVTMQGTTSTTVPEADGGTITEGAYELMQIAFFGTTMSAGHTLRSTKVFSQGTLSSTTDSEGITLMSSGPYTVSGNELTWAITCPEADADTITYSFTSNGSSLVLEQVQGDSTTVSIDSLVQ